MKKYKLSLSIGMITWIDADRCEEKEGWYRFYRGDSMVAEFAKRSVRQLEVPNLAPVKTEKPLNV